MGKFIFLAILLAIWAYVFLDAYANCENAGSPVAAELCRGNLLRMQGCGGGGY